MNALSRRWLASLLQPTISVQRPASSNPHDVRLTGTPAVLFLLGLAALVVGFVVRFLVVRRQARVNKHGHAEAAAALAQSEHRYRLLFDHSPCAMCVFDAVTSNILEVNDAAVAMYGYSREEFARMSFRDLSAPGNRAQIGSGDRIEVNAAYARQVARHVRRDGDTIDVEIQEHAATLPSRKSRLVVVSDVTERLASERAVQSAREVLQSVFDVGPQAIVVADDDGTIAQWNRAAERLFGWTAAEVLGKPSPFLPSDLPVEGRSRQLSSEMSAHGKLAEVRQTRKDGTAVDVLMASAPLTDSTGKPSGSAAVYTDLTERKLLEEQLRQSQKMEAIGTLAGGIAHDFNNILTVITSYSSLLLEEATDEKQRTQLAEVGTAARKATELTRQLLTFSRRDIVRLRPVSINEAVDSLRPMLRRLLSANIDVVTTLSPATGFVVADPSQLEQIVMNLAVNAADAMPDGGTLVVETRDVELDLRYAEMHAGVRPGMYVMLAVSDTGTGMDAATLRKIFEPFFTTKEVGRGTGLGLATVYAIVNQLGGTIWVYSEPGHGATFKIYLPRDGTRRVSLTPVAVPVAKTTSVTVLLVEDDEPVRRAVRRMLERFGHLVVEAVDGEAGLVVAAEYDGSMDVVVTDLMMPRMNGRAFAAALEKTRPGIPVIFTSGYTDDAVLRRGFVGANHTFLQKPFTGEQLAGAISAVIAASKEPEADGETASGE
jgi:two-component system, cell cycle sensor histidine kinase and response regulator CckA